MTDKLTAEETAEILMQSENLEASKIILEQYANQVSDNCLKEIIKEIDSLETFERDRINSRHENYSGVGNFMSDGRIDGYCQIFELIKSKLKSK